MPVQRLKSDAKNKYNSYVSSLKSEANVNGEAPLDERDFLALELLAWFKNEFFRWINQPDCESCNTSEHMIYKLNDSPNADERVGLARNVEVYE